MEDLYFKANVEWVARSCARSRGCFQSMRSVSLLFGFLPSLCLSQIVPGPEFQFEKLSWGDSLLRVKEILHGRVLREQNAEEQLGAAAVAMPSSVLLSYQDTLIDNPFRVVLWFSKGEQRLTRVVVALIHPKAGEHKEKMDEEAIFSIAWERLTEHYGPSFVDGSIPLVGKSRMWSFRGTDVSMMSVSGLGKKNLTMTYSQNRKK